MKKIKIILAMLIILAVLPVRGVYAQSITGPITVEIVLPEPVLISTYSSVGVAGGNFDISYYDVNNVKLASRTSVSLNMAFAEPQSHTVKRVVIDLRSGSTMTQFNMFTGLNSTGTKYTFTDFNIITTPSATPTPTPTPTPAPTATPSVTPSATPKPTPTATPEQPTGDRAILTITMINGVEKEYDLPIAEVDAFLTWYDARDAGRGPGMYAIDKHTNNKGPFSKRKDYVVFDKILTFEVSEYTAK